MTPGSQNIDITRLGSLALFDGVDAATLSSIADGGRAFAATRGQRIASRGERLDGFYVVCDGALKVYMLSSDGAERTLRILQTGDNFGVALMTTGLPSPVFAETLAPSRIVFIPRSLADAALHHDMVFTEALLIGMGRLVLDLVNDIESSCMMNARERTASFLLRLADSGQSGRETVDLPASKWIVAGLLNLTPETFSRELHRLQDAGLIEIARRTIHIRDLTGLNAIVDDRAGSETAKRTQR